VVAFRRKVTGPAGMVPGRSPSGSVLRRPRELADEVDLEVALAPSNSLLPIPASLWRILASLAECV